MKATSAAERYVAISVGSSVGRWYPTSLGSDVCPLGVIREMMLGGRFDAIA
jgi:hypothetical protein